MNDRANQARHLCIPKYVNVSIPVSRSNRNYSAILAICRVARMAE